MSKLEELVDRYVISYHINPMKRIIIGEEVLLESLKEELPYLRKYDQPITVDTLRTVIHQYVESNFFDDNEESQDMFDAAFSCVYTITKKIWSENPDNDKDDVEFVTERIDFTKEGKVFIVIRHC